MILMLFFWPALMIYILHNLGHEFLYLYQDLNQKKQNIVLFHIIIGILCFMIDLILLLYCSKLLNIDLLTNNNHTHLDRIGEKLDTVLTGKNNHHESNFIEANSSSHNVHLI